MLHGTYFTELFLTRSSARRRILFAINKKGLWSIFSLPQHLSPYEKSSSSLILTAELHMKFPPENMRYHYHDGRGYSCGYTSGLICFDGMRMKEREYYEISVICNPTTGRYVALPYLQRYRKGYSFFGFDPIDKQFKVLFMAGLSSLDHHKILTLGTGEMRWRKINCSLRHNIAGEGICINGVLYYLVETSENMSSIVIVCFDVRSEKFKFIYPEFFCDLLINYMGKLGVIYYDEYAGDAFALRVWVLKDAEKQEWLQYAYTLRDDTFLNNYYNFVVGVSAMGEIVFSMAYFTSEKPFYIFYFNPEMNTLQRVNIQGFGGYHEHEERQNHSRVYLFANHVEDLNVNDSKLLKSSIYVPYLKREKKKNQKKEKMKKENKIETSIGVR